MLPEGFYHHIFYLRYFIFHESFIDEESGNIDERAAFLLIIHKGETSIPEIVLNAWTENLITIHLDEDGSRIECCAVFLDRSKTFLCRDNIEHIQPHRSFPVSRVEDNHILRSFLRGECDDIVDEVAMRVDDTESISIPEILPCEVTDEYRFSTSGLSDDILVTASIFFVEVDRSFPVPVLIPSHEYGVLEEGKSCEFPLLYLLAWRLFSIDRFPFIFSVRKYWDGCAIKEHKITIRITKEIFVLVDLEYRSIIGEDIATRVTFIIKEHRRIRRSFEIRWRRQHLVVEPLDDRRLIVCDIWKVEHRREFVCRESTYGLEDTQESEAIGEVAYRSEEEGESIFDDLRIVELITVFIGEDRCRSEEICESSPCIFTGIRGDEYAD